jgi:hypothetical protein
MPGYPPAYPQFPQYGQVPAWAYPGGVFNPPLTASSHSIVQSTMPHPAVATAPAIATASAMAVASTTITAIASATASVHSPPMNPSEVISLLLDAIYTEHPDDPEQ